MCDHTSGTFLNGPDSDALLEYAIRNQARFEETRIGRAYETDSRIRRSLRFVDLGPFYELVERRANELLEGLIRELRVTPFVSTALELELVAHGDGAYYKRHIDLYTGTADRQHNSSDRLVSLVAYFHSRPKRFSGGQLVLYPDPRPGRQQTSDSVVIEPAHASFAAFASWIPHEVRPVSCPTGRFDHSRFSLNCWFLRRT